MLHRLGLTIAVAAILGGTIPPEVVGPVLAWLAAVLAQPHMLAGLAFLALAGGRIYAAGWNGHVEQQYQAALGKAERERAEGLR